MSDLIKVRLSGEKWKDSQCKEGVDYMIFENHQCIFYDKTGKELWRETNGLLKEFQSESKETMSDLIKVRLSGKKWKEARDKGADYFILDDNEKVFYDRKGKELWREKDSQCKDLQSESKEQ